MLLEVACDRSLIRVFEDLIFHAKFADRASTVLRRIGTGNNDTEKLSAEFTAAVGKVSAHIRTLLDQSPPAEREAVESRFLTLTPSGLERLLALCSELARVKNYLLDGHTLPCNSGENEVC